MLLMAEPPPPLLSLPSLRLVREARVRPRYERMEKAVAAAATGALVMFTFFAIGLGLSICLVYQP